uniref:CSON011025 protein n=1 Tax=Culicoides sonorensis TaxID=179676 RepID=A0A336MZF7_CULSO
MTTRFTALSIRLSHQFGCKNDDGSCGHIWHMLPFQIYFIVTSYYPEITNSVYIQEIYLGIYWLAMSNSMVNPVIYCIMNARFRRGFKQFFFWCPFINIPHETLTRREVVTSRYSCSGSPDHRIIRNGNKTSFKLLYIQSHTDTERSFLYTCPGSPKGSARKSHVIPK